MTKNNPFLNSSERLIYEGLIAKEAGEIIPAFHQEIINFDIAYDYSDDINAWRAGKNHETALKIKLETYEGEDYNLLKSAIETVQGHSRLRNAYKSLQAPHDREWYARQSNRLGLFLRSFSEKDCSLLEECLSKLALHLKSRKFNGECIYTDSAPKDTRSLTGKASVNAEMMSIVTKLYCYSQTPELRDLLASLDHLKLKEGIINFRINADVLYLSLDQSSIELYLMPNHTHTS